MLGQDYPWTTILWLEDLDEKKITFKTPLCVKFQFNKIWENCDIHKTYFIFTKILYSFKGVKGS